MSKIFTISGSSRYSNRSVFTGEIVVDEKNGLCGYSYLPVTDERKVLRFLVGKITFCGESRSSLEFYELANDFSLSPIIYKMSDWNNPRTGRWMVPNRHPEYRKIDIMFEEQPYSREAEDRIISNFNKVNKSTLKWVKRPVE